MEERIALAYYGRYLAAKTAGKTGFMYYYGTAGPADGLYNSILIQRTQGSQVYYLYGNTLPPAFLMNRGTFLPCGHRL